MVGLGGARGVQKLERGDLQWRLRVLAIICNLPFFRNLLIVKKTLHVFAVEVMLVNFVFV